MHSNLFFRFCAVTLAILLNSGCLSLDSQIQITNSKYFHLDPEKEINSPDPMVRFEQLHFLHGAVTDKEKKQRAGHYYVFWWTDPSRSPATIRFEYRQKKTGSEVYYREVKALNPRTKNKTRFQVTGKEYHSKGKVTAWRVSIIRENQIIASDQSYLW